MTLRWELSILDDSPPSSLCRSLPVNSHSDGAACLRAQRYDWRFIPFHRYANGVVSVFHAFIPSPIWIELRLPPFSDFLFVADSSCTDKLYHVISQLKME